jgi:hypothetical protein
VSCAVFSLYRQCLIKSEYNSTAVLFHSFPVPLIMPKQRFEKPSEANLSTRIAAQLTWLLNLLLPRVPTITSAALAVQVRLHRLSVRNCMQ